MKKFLSLKYLTSVCFLALIGFMLIYNARPTFYVAYHQLENIRSGSGFSKAQAEYEYNDSLPGKAFYVTFNGGFQKLMGLRHVNQRYQLDNGHLTYVVPEMDVTEMAENTVAFRDALEDMDIPFVYINTLFKIDPDDKQLPFGVEDYSNENADQFLSILENHNVPVLDLRELKKEQGLDHYSLYYPTDHHWTAETGFWAYKQIISWLEMQDASFSVDPRLTQEENYHHDVYEDIFCGSGARRVGLLYGGLDDLTVIHPKFDTSLELFVTPLALFRQGGYEDTVLFYDKLTRENVLESYAYNVYLDEDYAQVNITNLSHSKGMDVQSNPKKLLVLKDSCGLVVAPFLALSYDEVCLIDLRAFEQNLMEYIQEYQPDMVLTMYNPGALEEKNLSMFQFIR